MKVTERNYTIVVMDNEKNEVLRKSIKAQNLKAAKAFAKKWFAEYQGNERKYKVI